MEIELFGSRLSPFVEKVARALQWKGLPFRLVRPRGPGDLGRWNPTTGKMPVLDIDGRRSYDSSRILRLLDGVKSEPGLFSDDPSVARRQAFVEDWSDESLYWYAMAFRWTSVNAEATKAQVMDALPVLWRPLAALVLPRQILAQTRAQGLARLPLDVLTEEVAHRFDELVELLGQRPYFFSDRPSAADLAIFGQMSLLRSGPTPQAAKMLDKRPSLAAFYDRVDRTTAPHIGEGRRAARAA